MGLFNKKNEGGLRDVIRCDENTTKKENAIRYGVRLSIKDGEVAVFVYPGENGNQDFIEGPFFNL